MFFSKSWRHFLLYSAKNYGVFKRVAINYYKTDLKKPRTAWHHHHLCIKIHKIYRQLGQDERAAFYLKQSKLVNYLINHESKIIYCAIPKNACSLFRSIMIENSPERKNFNPAVHNVHVLATDSNSSLRMTNFSFLDPQKKYFKFIILRNPFHRLVSAYLDKIVKPDPSDLEFYVVDLIKSIHQNLGRPYDPQQSISFRQFVEFLAKKEDIELNEHWRPQHTFPGIELSQFTEVISFEQLNDSIDELAQKLKLELPERIPHMNQTVYSINQHFSNTDIANFSPKQLKALPVFPCTQQFYTADLSKSISRRYAKDIAWYEQAFGIKCRI